MKVIFICGATATGKSQLAFDWARRTNSEIVSFDSVQVYRKLDIGTAKPSAEMLKSVRHHLIDVIDPDELFTAGDFRRKALEILESLSATRGRVIFVGGTGFYLQALLKGMFDLPPVAPEYKKKLLEDLSALGTQELYREVCRLDPEYGTKIHENDTYRILRALEILRSTGRTITEVKNSFKVSSFPYPYVQIGLRRKKNVLKDAIRLRTKRMLAGGLIDETERLLKEYPQKPRCLDSVGYRESVAFLQGGLAPQDLEEAILRSTFHLAKRQATWFNRDSSIKWYDPDEEGVDLRDF